MDMLLALAGSIFPQLLILWYFSPVAESHTIPVAGTEPWVAGTWGCAGAVAGACATVLVWTTPPTVHAPFPSTVQPSGVTVLTKR